VALVFGSVLVWACGDEPSAEPAPRPVTTMREAPLGIAYPCSPVVEVLFERASPWPVGRYYLRITRDQLIPLTCAIEFEPVVGAVIDTCNDRSPALTVAYAYDASRREITKLQLSWAEHSVDVEVFLAEDGPRVAELHHELTRECLQSLTLDIAEPSPLSEDPL